jgi:hypothetical protein
MRISSILAVGVVILISRSSVAGEPPPPAKPPAPTPAASSASPADCSDCRHGESHFRHFLAWALYHPPAKGYCNCLPKPVLCCTPPLYLWFPCQGFGGCGAEGCTSCGEAAGPCKSDCYRFFHRGKE